MGLLNFDHCVKGLLYVTRKVILMFDDEDY